ncbi:transcriptional antiterminator [Shewanella psychropiezotolerans]|uniref:Transcriptional antiterminator n=1 Tax=Shewanella psychropiezotolerans TaxID=2593655 RepID=A0ABX5X3Z5_9GAMM|nr:MULTISPECIES: Rho-binding antiterminator [Shewanella]MPY25579.1 transcriptional antiterminator [Shewanella sp. YLB-07]QDO86066.1 transcriptional antiterminator [Shewanella psychropiezotolerans]
MSTYKILDCGIHDYLELACMRSYSLVIELTGKKTITGTALNIETRRDKSEYLMIKLKQDQGQELKTISIRLDQIVAFTPISKDASFEKIEVQIT